MTYRYCVVVGNAWVGGLSGTACGGVFFLEFKPIREQNYAFFLCAPKFTLHKRTNFLHSGYKW